MMVPPSPVAFRKDRLTSPGDLAAALPREVRREHVRQCSTLSQGALTVWSYKVPVLAPRAQMMLARRRDKSAQMALATTREILPAAQWLLADSENHYVRSRLAGCPGVLPEVLEKLSGDPVDTVRRSVALSVNLPEELGEEMLKHACPLVLYALGENSSMAPEFLHRLATGHTHGAGYAVARNPSAAHETLLFLLSVPPPNSGQYWLRYAAAQNPALSRDVIDLLSDTTDTRNDRVVFRHLLQNPRFTFADQSRLAAVAGANVTQDAFLHVRRLAPDVQATMARSPTPSQRRAAAYSENLSVELQLLLAQDPDRDVRQALLDGSCSPEALDVLARDAASSIRDKVARCSRSTPDVLALLAKDNIQRVRAGVARHPRASPDTLLLLADDRALEVRRAVASNKFTPAHVLQSRFPVTFLPREVLTSWLESHPSREDLMALAKNWVGTYLELLEAQRLL